jgi:hypothetical protein
MDGRERHPTNNRDGIDFPENADFVENNDSASVDIEVEDRLADWLETNRIENSTPVATLYKLIGETGETREQVDYFRGVIPSRHEIGLNYGPGRYIMIIRNTTGMKGAKTTTIRFRLHESYKEKNFAFKREQVEKERFALGQPNALPPAVPAPQSGKESLLEAFTLVRSMQADTMAMFKPILERLLTPATPAIPMKSVTPFEEYALTRQILKDNLKENVSMFSTMQKALIDSRSPSTQDDDDTDDLPAEKQSLFEKIIALAEPFINILAQNNTAAKMAAAGIKAAPQFKEVIRDASLARRIISYVEEKEGPERASIALNNLGISRADYTPPSKSTPAQGTTPRPPVAPAKKPLPPPRTTKQENRPGGAIKAAGGKGLNPKMEVKV